MHRLAANRTRSTTSNIFASTSRNFAMRAPHGGRPLRQLPNERRLEPQRIDETERLLHLGHRRDFESRRATRRFWASGPAATRRAPRRAFDESCCAALPPGREDDRLHGVLGRPRYETTPSRSRPCSRLATNVGDEPMSARHQRELPAVRTAVTRYRSPRERRRASARHHNESTGR
jgi:hypothetical protein